MYKSFNDENVVAYLYWDLIWDKGGLVTLENPWDKNKWTTGKGYIKTKDFYAFKQYSAFIHPNWIRINSSNENENVKTLAFISPGLDSVSLVMVNRSETENINVNISVNDFNHNRSSIYRTSENDNCMYLGALDNSNFTLQKKSITTVQLTTSNQTNIKEFEHSANKTFIYPNPVTKYATIKIPRNNTGYDFVSVIDISGKVVRKYNINNDISQKQDITINCDGITAGLYYYKIESNNGENLIGKFIIK
jgi:glucuronoarabinoxylan endo-1,4-beta-xylanase